MLQVMMGRLDSLPWKEKHVPRWNPVIEAHPASQALRVGIAAEAAATGQRNGLAVQMVFVTDDSCRVWWRVVYDRRLYDRTALMVKPCWHPSLPEGQLPAHAQAAKSTRFLSGTMVAFRMHFVNFRRKSDAQNRRAWKYNLRS